MDGAIHRLRRLDHPIVLKYFEDVIYDSDRLLQFLNN
jgi:hypothetical protein